MTQHPAAATAAETVAAHDLMATAGARPEVPALLDGQGACGLSRAAFDEMVSRQAAGLGAAGIGAGDRVWLADLPAAQRVPLALAGMRAGALVQPGGEPGSGVPDLTIARQRPGALPETAAWMRPDDLSGPAAPSRGAGGALALPDPAVPGRLIVHDLGALARVGAAFARRYALGPADRVGIVGDPGDGRAWMAVASALASGAAFGWPGDAEGLRAQAPTVLVVCGPGIAPPATPLAGLRLAYAPEAADLWLSGRPEASRLSGMWMPEALGLPVCSDPRDPPATVATTCGRPLPGHEVMIVDPRTGMDVDLYTTGEVWLRGPAVFRGYLDAPAATACRRGRDGFLRTGRPGHLDAEGRVVLSEGDLPGTG